MEMKLYQMTFQHAHFGEGQLNTGQPTFDASRLYSALFLEACKLGREKELYTESKKASFQLSDAFPYINEMPYLPKPIGYPRFREAGMQSLKKARQEAKKVKKIRYLPADEMKAFLKQQISLDKLAESQKQIAVQIPVTRKGQDPYEVGMSAFQNSLYVLATQSELLDTLLDSLQYSGLGGKKTSGYGAFQLTIKPVPPILAKQLANDTIEGLYLSLTTSLPTDEELPVIMNDAAYLVKKASGFAYSETAHEQLRKQDLYKFAAGSTFTKPYQGRIVDVRPDGFPHPVWNYAKGLFYRLEEVETK